MLNQAMDLTKLEVNLYHTNPLAAHPLFKILLARKARNSGVECPLYERSRRKHNGYFLVSYTRP